MRETKCICVILVNFHQDKDTLECLSSLKKTKSTGLSQKVIVVQVDDKEQVELFKKHADDVLFVENKGFSGNNNAGILYAEETYQPDYYFLLNNDTTIIPTTLDELVSFYEKHKEASLLVPKIYFEKGYEFHKDAYTKEELGNVIWYAGGNIDWKNIYAWHRGVDEVDHGQFDTPVKTSFATGCAMFIPKKTFEDVGLLDPYYFLYLEDLDYSMRSRNRMGDIWYVPTSVVYHKNAGSSGGSGSDMQVYYQTRNRYFFGFKYGSFRTKLALIREMTRVMLDGTSTQKEAIHDLLTLKGGKRGGTI